MGFLDYFKHVPAWTVDEVRTRLQRAAPGEFNLIDVRQPEEYAQGHLPGAVLVPVAELDEHLDDFDRSKKTIVYCEAGLRSEAAAGMLRRSGFLHVATMEGGFRAWQGLVARGRPEMVMTWFFPAHRTEEYLALAWYLEEGTRLFYAKLAERLQDPAAALFSELSRAEVEHEQTLLDIYRVVTGGESAEGFPRNVLELGDREEEFMEGGLPFGKALDWCEGRSLREILELTIGLETSAYDRYLFMHDHLEEESARHVFVTLAHAEKQHLRRVSSYLDRLLAQEIHDGGRAQGGT